MNNLTCYYPEHEKSVLITNDIEILEKNGFVVSCELGDGAVGMIPTIKDNHVCLCWCNRKIGDI